MTGRRSVWRNLVDVVHAPRATFDDVREHARWAAPLTAVLVATAIVSYVMLPSLIQLQRLQVFDRIPLEKQAEALKQVEAFAGLPGLVLSVITTPVIMLLVTVLLWGFALVTGRQDARFSTAFTAIVYANVVYVLQALVQAAIIVVRGAEQVAADGGPPLFGLSLVVERAAVSPLAWGVLGNVNVFSIWHAFVLAIAGMHAMRMAREPAIAFAAVLWVVGGLVFGLQQG